MKCTRLSFRFLVYLVLLVTTIMIAGCAPAVTATSSAAPAAPQIAVPATATLPAPTVIVTTAPPSPTTPPAAATTAAPVAAAEQATDVPVTPSETPASQETPELGQKGLSAWCLPIDAAVSNAKDPLTPPQNAKKAKVTANSIEVGGLPSNGCMFLYTFDQAAVSGLKLELYELKQPKPFLTTDLQPASGKPEVAWAFLRHVVFTAPPKENLSLTFVVRDPLGQVLQRDQVNLHSWIPGTPGPKPNNDGDCGCTIDIP